MDSNLWIIVCIFFILVELINPENLICIWFSFGAFITYLFSALKLDTVTQLLIFSIVSLVGIISLRPLVKKYIHRNVVATNADRIIGKWLPLTKAIEPNAYGEIKYNGIVWNAVSKESSNISVGTTVHIVSIEGSKLVVEKLNDKKGGH